MFTNNYSLWKNLILTFTIYLGKTSIYAQEKAAEAHKTILQRHGLLPDKTLYCLIQAAFSNWVGGGANNVGWIAGVNYNFTYEKGKRPLGKNNVIQDTGKTIPKGTGNRKTQDILNLNTNHGHSEFALKIGISPEVWAFSLVCCWIWKRKTTRVLKDFQLHGTRLP